MTLEEGVYFEIVDESGLFRARMLIGVLCPEQVLWVARDIAEDVIDEERTEGESKDIDEGDLDFSDVL